MSSVEKSKKRLVPTGCDKVAQKNAINIAQEFCNKSKGELRLTAGKIWYLNRFLRKK